MIKGWKKLTKKEKNHVTFDAGCRNTEAMIAKKLGDWPEQTKEESK